MGFLKEGLEGLGEVGGGVLDEGVADHLEGDLELFLGVNLQRREGGEGEMEEGEERYRVDEEGRRS